MKIGVVGTSLKENERRVPIYPEHLLWIDEGLRKRMYFQTGYGKDYGFDDDYFAQNSAGVISRDALFAECDIMLLPKPVNEDLLQMKEGQVLWGWPHCVQQVDMAQIAIDRKLTFIAWEAMHLWSSAGERLMHIFYKNNEIAGYASALHMLQLLGMDGHYGPRKKVVVTGYGSVSRGAIYALQGRGFNNIHVYTCRPTHLVADQNPDVYYHHMETGDDGVVYVKDSGAPVRPLIDDFSEADVICNGVMQDTDNPMMFVPADQVERLKPRTMIIDISCDEGMGFAFAKPTTFDDPVFTVGDNITYYSVDHTPTYLWNAASREISKAVQQYLPIIAAGPEAWEQDKTVSTAIEIKDGVIRNPKILSFQNRSDQYPHEKLG